MVEGADSTGVCKELVVAGDDEVRGDGRAAGAGGEICDVALEPGEAPCPGLERAVDALGGAALGLLGLAHRKSFRGIGELLRSSPSR